MKTIKLNIKFKVIFIIGVLVSFAVLLRVLHLYNNSGHNFLLTPDSYFFHWLAERIIAGAGVPSDAPSDAIYAFHSGLAYPLAYLAKLTGGADSLDIVCKIVPVILGFVGMIMTYFAGTWIFNRRVGLFSALTWVVLPHTLLLTSAGFIDRDALSMLLIMTGAFLFYLTNGWVFKIGTRDVGWLLVGVCIIIIEGIIYLEWIFIGPVLLFAILTAYVLGSIAVKYSVIVREEIGVMQKLRSAVDTINWRAYSLVFTLNIVIIIIGMLVSNNGVNIVSSITNLAEALGGQALGEADEAVAAEMHGLGLGDIIGGYHLFLIPIIIGFTVAWRKRSQGGIFFACWFMVILLMSLLAKRVLLYAAPAACMLSAMGIGYLWDWMQAGKQRSLKKAGVFTLLCLSILLALVSASKLDSADFMMSPNANWQNVMSYLREQTPHDSVIMASWSYGYWILDLGQRRPLTDNGFYDYTKGRLDDTALAYRTVDADEIVAILDKHKCDYIVFTDYDFDTPVPYIGLKNSDKVRESIPAEAISMLSLKGKFRSQGRLVIKYSDLDGGIVILGLS